MAVLAKKLGPRAPGRWPCARLAIALAASALGGACAQTPFHPPSELPAAFEHSSTAVAEWSGKGWYRGFESQELVVLIELALQNNLDLTAAAARLRQADARVRAAGGALLPQVDAGASITRVIGGAKGEHVRETDWSALLSASYEIDFWGKHAATRQSAQWSAVASDADRGALALTTTAGVASAYFQVLSLRERLKLARMDLESVRAVLALVEARFNAGAASAAELAAQRAAVANAELRLPQLEQQEIETRGALAVMVGRNPEGFSIEVQQLDGLSEPEIAVGLPSELLRRRPDVLAAEANLQAAHADLAAARAALFPTVTLTGSGGVQNPAVQAAVATITGTGYSMSAGAGLLQTVFDGGQRRAARDEAAAKEQELLANYRAAILNALLDVETALSAVQHFNLQSAAQTESITQSERAFEGARLRYRVGSGDYLSMLESQRVLYAAHEQASQYKLAQLEAVVSLCKALGGGWQPAARDVSEQQSPGAR